MKAAHAKQVGSAISSVLKELGLAGKVRQYGAVDRWSEIVGERIARVTKAESIRDGKLLVRVSAPAWRNELTFLKRELIAKINAALGQEVVKEIIFK